MALTRRAWLAGGVATASAGLGRGAAAAGTDALATLRARLQAHHRATIPPDGAARWLAAMDADGRFGDIDYASTRSPDWPAARHLPRLRTLAAAWARERTATHPLGGDGRLLAAIERGLRAWLALEPRSSNWWFNDIGPQLALMPVLTLTHAALDPALATQARALLRTPADVPPARATGQNLVWFATQQLVRGALAGDAADVAEASARLEAEIAPRLTEGIQPDFGFHQHGRQLYSGGYGLAFLIDLAQMTPWLAGTPWDWSRASLETLADFALWGVRPLVRGPWLDWHARGREPARERRPPRLVHLAQALGPLAARLDGDAGRAEALRHFIEHLQGRRTGAAWTGNHHHWRSDTMAHQSAGGLVSLKTMSSRSVGTESGDGENRLGHWLPLGTHFIVRRGDEYEGLQPVLDWARLPGTTAPDAVPAFTGLLRGGTAASGGASDGRSGVMRLDLDRVDTQALKAWFFDGDSVVALSCGVRSRHPAPVATTLDQRRARGRVVLDGQALDDGELELVIDRPGWLWHDGVAYASLDGGPWRLRRGLRRGSWQRVGAAERADPVEAPVFMLTREHGRQPDGAGAAYRVWLGADDPAAMAAMPPVRVLANEPALQAVRHDASGLVQASLRRPGTLLLDDEGLELQVDAAVLVQWRPGADGGRLTLADPAGRLQAVTVRLRKASGRERVQRIVLPGTPATQGRSVTQPLAWSG